MRKWLFLGLWVLLLGVSATPALAQKSTPVPTPTPEPAKPTPQPTPTEAIPPTNTPPPPATATEAPPPPTNTSPPPAPSATSPPSPVPAATVSAPSPTIATTVTVTDPATLAPTVVTGGEPSATASATLPPPTATPTRRPTNAPKGTDAPKGTGAPTVESEPAHSPRASEPPVVGGEEQASGEGLPWGVIGSLIGVVAFVAVALGVGLQLGRRTSAGPASVSAPDPQPAGTEAEQKGDQGQVLVLDLGQVKAQLVQSMSDQQLAIAAEELLVEPLSQREQEVLELIAQGLTNREVAQKLFITTNTVKVHTRNIYGKLDVSNRTQAIAKARALGILTDA